MGDESLASAVHPWRLAVLERSAPDLVRLLAAPVPVRPIYYLPKDYLTRREETNFASNSFTVLRNAMDRRQEVYRQPGRFSLIGFRQARTEPFELVSGPERGLEYGLPEPFLEWALRRRGIEPNKRSPDWDAGLARVRKFLARRAEITNRCLRASEGMFASGGWHELTEWDAFLIDGRGPSVRLLEASGFDPLRVEISRYYGLFKRFRDRAQEILR